MIQPEDVTREGGESTPENPDDEYRGEMQTVDEYFDKHYPGENALPNYKQVRELAHRIMYQTPDITHLQNRQYVAGEQFPRKYPNLTKEERAALEKLIQHRIASAQATSESVSVVETGGGVEATANTEKDGPLSPEDALERFDTEGFRRDIEALQVISGESYDDTAKRVLELFQQYAVSMKREDGTEVEGLPVPGMSKKIRIVSIDLYKRTLNAWGFRNAGDGFPPTPIWDVGAGDDPVVKQKLQELFARR